MKKFAQRIVTALKYTAYRFLCGILVMFWPQAVVVFPTNKGARFYAIGMKKGPAIACLHQVVTNSAKDAFNGRTKVPLAELASTFPTMSITLDRGAGQDFFIVSTATAVLCNVSYTRLRAAKNNPAKLNITCVVR